MNRKTFFLLVTVALCCLPAIASAQTGRWVEYDPDEFGAGTAFYDRGDACIGYTRDGAQYFLIFDANTGEWERFDLNQAQDFAYVQSRGEVVFGYSSTALIAYSATLEQWDTISYVGNILYEDWQEGKRSYGCADEYAFMATDQKVYVFEAALGMWSEYAYTIPPDYLTGKFYPREDYLALQLSRSTSYSPPMIIVYSTHTNSFNSLDNGCFLYTPFMKHGFASRVALDGSGDNYQMVGYSAFDNEFDIQTYTTGASEGGISGGISWDDELGSHTSYVAGFRRGESYVGAHCNYYGYDTRRGVWDHQYVFYDLDVEYHSGYLMNGGQLAFDLSLYDDIDTYHFTIYSGLTGQFTQVGTDVEYKSTTSGHRVGGTVALFLDTLQAWTYDIVDEQASLQSLAYAKSSNLYAGDDFVSFCRWHTDSTQMRMYFYNSRTDNWQTIDMADEHTNPGMGTPYVFMFNAADDDVVLFYSTYRDEIVTRPYTSGTSPYFRIRGDLAYSRTDDVSYVYNAATGQMVEFDFNLDQNGLGTHSGAFADDDTRTLHGYSMISGNVTTTTIADDPYYTNDTGYIGIVTAQTFNKVYAFNSFADSWVELIPVGSHSQLLVGDMTALVVRYSPDMLYAFDPQGIVTGINDEPELAVLPQSPALSQNYPNPFNPSTTIEFSLSRRDDVEIVVFNTLGQAVRLLVNEALPAGNYRVVWDGLSDRNEALASGVYFYRINAGNFREARKMLLLK